jgi:hypothetical protein
VTIDAVVKLGGSLLGGADLPSLVDALTELAKHKAVVVVPGGGAFADAVRVSCARHEPGESAAHWMAILAMDQHAHLLAGIAPTARIVQSPEDVAATVARGRLAILAPFAWLRVEDPLPHGWHVTSDSIAAWVAARLAAGRLLLLKSVEGVPDTNGEIAAAADLGSPALAGVVDGYFAHALEPGPECWILSGRHPERIAELFENGRTRGTRVRPRAA